MVTRAFVLIETQVGKSRQVAESLRSIEGIKSADVITGNLMRSRANRVCSLMSLPISLVVGLVPVHP